MKIGYIIKISKSMENKNTFASHNRHKERAFDNKSIEGSQDQYIMFHIRGKFPPMIVVVAVVRPIAEISDG